MIEECFQNAKECEEKAQTIDEEDVRAFYRTLAEQWRRLALIVAKHPSKYDECATSDAGRALTTTTAHCE